MNHLKSISWKLSFHLLSIIFLISGNTSAQLSGNKYIPGDYATISDAIADLNISSIGGGGVTFNIAAGMTFQESPPEITATGSQANPIVFQKSGAGSNPKIIPSTPGIHQPEIGRRHGDGIIIITGGDFIVFDGIDLQENSSFTDTAKTEYGYYLKRKSASDGCKNITIKNCSISMDIEYGYSYAIFSSCIKDSENVILNDVGGIAENIKIYNNKFSYIYGGILLEGFNIPELYDQNIEIGVEGSNYFTGFNEGVSSYYQNHLRIENNYFSDGGGIYTGESINSNIDIINNTFTSAGGINNYSGSRISTGITNTINIKNNIIENSVITPSFGYIYCNSNAAIFNITGNIIRNNSAYEWIDLISVTIPTSAFISDVNISDNSLYNNSTFGHIVGIFLEKGKATRVFNNTIYNLSGSSATGIYFNSGTNYKCYNNFISELYAPFSTEPSVAIAGIRIGGGSVSAAYNTIYLDAEPNQPEFSTTGIYYVNQYAALELINNNIVNHSTPGALGYTSVIHGYLYNYGANSNNNNFYAGIPGPRNLIYQWEGNYDQTIEQFKTRVAPRDNASFSELAPFANISVSPYDLHLNSIAPSQSESGGKPVSYVSVDYDNEPRNSITPDVGADEFITGFDIFPPLITHTPLSYTSSLSNRTAAAIIIDTYKVDTGVNGPRLYYKKHSDAGYSVDAIPVISGNEYVFTIDYSLLGGGAAAIGDTIYYYLAAQDTSGNIVTFPKGGSGSNPPGTTPPQLLNKYFIIDQPLSGSYTIGLNEFNKVHNKNITFEKILKTALLEVSSTEPKVKTRRNPNTESASASKVPQSINSEEFLIIDNGKVLDNSFYSSKDFKGVYPTITAAVNDLNMRGASGPVAFILADELYANENPIEIKDYPGSGSNNSLLIKPAPGVCAVITGSNLQHKPIITLNGADYVTIDGSVPADDTATNIIIRANSLWSAGIKLFNQANNNVIRNVKVETNIRDYESGAIFITGENNNNNTVENSIICALEGVNNYYSIGILFDESAFHSNTRILNNKITGFIYSGIDLNGDSIIVKGNKISDSYLSSGILGIAAGGNVTLEANEITNLRTNYLYGNITGILVYGGDSDVKLINNLIVLGSNSLGYIGGIEYYGWYCNIDIFFNTIHILGNSQTYGSGIANTKYTPALTYNFKNNLLVNTRIDSSEYNQYAIMIADTEGVTSLDFNNYFVPTGYIGSYATIDCDSLSEWSLVTSQDFNSHNTDPLFAGENDYRLFENSPLLQAGIYINGITTDILGHPRGTPPTIGAYEIAVPVPVELDLFEAAVSGNSVSLNWRTITESNTSSFFIERKEKDYWISAAVVPAAGNSTEPVEYSYTDKNLLSGKYSYRLKITDYDGTWNYSNEIETEIGIPNVYDISQNYPNPFNPSTRINYQIPADANVKIELFSITGERIYTMVNENQPAGFYTLTFSADRLNLASGVYIYRITAHDDQSINFIRTMKMMILK